MESGEWRVESGEWRVESGVLVQIPDGICLIHRGPDCHVAGSCVACSSQ